jgi:hypothetical protein
MKTLGVVIVGAVLMTMAGSLRMNGGQFQPPPGQSGRIPGQQQKTGVLDPEEPDPMAPHRDQQQARLRNEDRQKRLVADTDKLLTLATDLKEQVDKSTKDTLSVDVIKKADEIEKLAHNVKERMKG